MYMVVYGVTLYTNTLRCPCPALSVPPGGSAPSLAGSPQATPRSGKLTKIQVSWRTPVRQNMTMPGSETQLYAVKWHSAVVRGRRLAADRPGFTLGVFSGPPWARLGMLHLARLNGSQGRFGWLTPGLRRGDPVRLGCPPSPPCQGHPGVKILPKYEFPGEPQCAKI